MQSVRSRIWTRVAVSISYDDNDYTTGTSMTGACDVMVIVVRNGHDGSAVYIAHTTNTLRKGIHPTILPPAMDK